MVEPHGGVWYVYPEREREGSRRISWDHGFNAKLACNDTPDYEVHIMYEPMVLVSCKPYNMYRTLQTNRTSLLDLQES
jgi:hypothetical protein